MQAKQSVPAGYHTVTPYLICKDAAGAIDFYKRAFGAEEVMRMPGRGGRVGHAEVKIGDSRVMLVDEHPESDFLGPQARGGSPVHLYLYVEDADALAARAVEAGAKLLRKVEDQFYGDRLGTVEDPYGHVWYIATRKEDLSVEALQKRAKEKAGA